MIDGLVGMCGMHGMGMGRVWVKGQNVVWVSAGYAYGQGQAKGKRMGKEPAHGLISR